MKINKITPPIAAMYLGQQADHKSPVLGFASVREIDTVSVSDLQCGIVVITPHLRRMESITEEEAQDLHEVSYGFRFSGVIECRSWLYRYSGELQYTHIRELIGHPPAFIYLLSKGFDIFGLIDAGLAKEIQPELCQQCKKNEATEPHTCPYAEDVQGDSETLCNCCEDCEGECSQDI